MSGHWADAYVGRPAQTKRPCWELVRQIWIEQLGFIMPRFDELDDPSEAIALGAAAFRQVPKGEEREMDAVMMMVPMRRSAAGRAFVPVEHHMGIVVKKGLVLHVEEGGEAMIEPLKEMKVSRILRGPWGGA